MADHKRNIEIKAKLADEKEFNEKVEIAVMLTGDQSAEIIEQHDVFFKVPMGRLKLRYEVSFNNKMSSFEAFCLS